MDDLTWSALNLIFDQETSSSSSDVDKSKRKRVTALKQTENQSSMWNNRNELNAWMQPGAGLAPDIVQPLQLRAAPHPSGVDSSSWAYPFSRLSFNESSEDEPRSSETAESPQWQQLHSPPPTQGVSKSTRSSVKKSPKDILDHRDERRRERNRQAAQRSRQRKLSYIKELEEKVLQLKQENNALRRRIRELSQHWLTQEIDKMEEDDNLRHEYDFRPRNRS